MSQYMLERSKIRLFQKHAFSYYSSIYVHTSLRGELNLPPYIHL